MNTVLRKWDEWSKIDDTSRMGTVRAMVAALSSEWKDTTTQVTAGTRVSAIFAANSAPRTPSLPSEFLKP